MQGLQNNVNFQSQTGFIIEFGYQYWATVVCSSIVTAFHACPTKCGRVQILHERKPPGQHKLEMVRQKAQIGAFLMLDISFLLFRGFVQRCAPSVSAQQQSTTISNPHRRVVPSENVKNTHKEQWSCTPRV